jgi:glycerol-3-phosphate dehydrogenase (NAD(P)+)
MSFLAILISYVLGSIPSAVWISRAFAGIDIRTRGSKNAGLTNVYRVLGWRPALPVAIIDFSKGLAAVLIGMKFHGSIEFGLLCGAAAVLGHSYTMFAGFRGGKGVLTTLGVFVALSPTTALLAFALWIVILWISGYVSLASILAAAFLGLENTVVVAFKTLTSIRIHTDHGVTLWDRVWQDLSSQGSISLLVFSWIVALFVIVKHKANIHRLMAGTENRFGKKAPVPDLQEKAARRRREVAEANLLDPDRVAILGGGSWGSAIAKVLGDKGITVMLWEYGKEAAERMQTTRECDKLPGVILPATVTVTSDLALALDKSSVVAFVVPSHTLRSVCKSIAAILPESEVRKRHFVSLIKGIEEKTLLRMTEIVQEVIPGADADNVSILTGPSHAEEVGNGLATTVVLANHQEETAAALQDLFFAPSLRTYRSVDVVGVELCGAVKNVIAIASGILDGLDLGDNARAALMTRGMAEMARLGAKLGGSRESFFGLAGMGDLITTCISKHSRNRHVGEQVGRGRPLPEVLAEMSMVAEGVRTVSGVMELANRLNVEMPITAQVHAILFENRPARDALGLLMNRAAKNERE